MTAALSVLATAYGVGGALAILLQARRMLVLRAACEVSIKFLAIYAGGYAVWLAYGLALHSAALVVSDAVGLGCGGITLVVAVTFHGSCAAPDEDDGAALAEYDEARAYRALAQEGARR